MLIELEDLAAIGTLAFKHGARIMKAMGQHVNFRIFPVDEFAVQPDKPVSLIEWNRSHFLAPEYFAALSRNRFPAGQTFPRPVFPS